VSWLDALPPGERDRVLREQAQKDRAFELQKIDHEIAADTMAQNAMWREHISQAQHGMSAHEWERLQQERADARAQRDPSAPYGSERNPAVMIEGQVLDPLQPNVGRSRTWEDEQLSRTAAGESGRE